MGFNPVPKRKRIVDKKLLERMSYEPCVVCGSEERSPAHHIKSVGSGGDDVEDNLLPLCGPHHTEVHTMPIEEFYAKYGI